MRVPVALGEIQETLLIPLYGRALDARRRRSILGDTAAADLVEQIDYDFSKFRGPSLGGAVLRASIFDGWVRRFLIDHPDGTVVDLGCGLSTRFRRLDNGRVRWFDLDVGDTMALRRQFFADEDRYTMIEGSIHATDWYGLLRARGGPLFLLSEAVLLYFPEAQVHATLRQLAQAFPAAPLAFDTGGRAMMGSQDRNPVFRAVSARMRWTCDDPRTLQQCGLRLVESRTFADPQPDVAAGWPARYRLGMKALRLVLPPMVTTYKLNLLETAAADAG
ncbi:class I SAM-dependent methyltransferase [Skermania piniformis]|uniref:Class I SAM-dependent methyltransferase n=1 Tax=Skermania pinensis TaxID=39122 RepID=A0ABX8S6A9_9ACTN|nr:class I SAM-dependent methyltransferase [Skermania piniformis]QXQ13349.1 class I SAM-dependent methyltransferase [Skermania piniformis]